MKTEESDKAKERTSVDFLCVRFSVVSLFHVLNDNFSFGACSWCHMASMLNASRLLQPTRCKHVWLVKMCCWIYCISQNVSTSYTILAFPLRLQVCSFPILSYLFVHCFFLPLCGCAMPLLSILYHFALSMCYYFFHIIPLKRNKSDIHDAEYGALWIFLFFFLQHTMQLQLSSSFFVFFFIRSAILLHTFFLIYTYIYVCISVDAMALPQPPQV